MVGRFDELAVQSITNPKRGLQRLNVNITCPHLEGIDQNTGDQLNDRSIGIIGKAN